MRKGVATGGTTGEWRWLRVGLRANIVARRIGRAGQAPPLQEQEARACWKLIGTEGLEGEMDQDLDVGVRLGVG
jgi:hypothetical protein